MYETLPTFTTPSTMKVSTGTLLAKRSKEANICINIYIYIYIFIYKKPSHFVTIRKIKTCIEVVFTHIHQLLFLQTRKKQI